MVHTFLFLLYLIINTTATNDCNPTVVTPYGKIQGFHSESYSGRIYSAFLSIPYAQPPVEDLRFEEPQPIGRWYGTWVANFTTECAQLAHTANGGSFIGQEDCLYNNIFVPRKYPSTDDEPLDVIIHIPGGGLNFGSSFYYSGEKHLMDKDVILVTFNYRVGPLGFLSTEDATVPGNSGMKDQVAAIKWIKENIKFFGGNPQSITLTGLSAGASSVHFHYLSPLSEGLFKGGISLSGTVLVPWTFQKNALKQARQLAKAVGCDQDLSVEFISCMKQRSVVHICESIRIFKRWLFNPFSVFGVVVEKYGKQRFLSEHPYELLRKGKIHDLPWITSTTSNEGIYPMAEFIADENYLSKLEAEWDNLAPHILHFIHTVDPKLKSAVAKKIKKYYFKNKAISHATNQELIQVGTDRLFVVDAEKATRLQAKANKSPTYFYRFSYVSEVLHTHADIAGLKLKKRLGIGHGDDIGFTMNSPKLALQKLSQRDLKMREIFLNMWLSFAQTGAPDIGGKDWKPVTDSNLMDYLDIMSPEQLVMKQCEEMGNRNFWDSLEIKENNNLFSQSKDEL